MLKCAICVKDNDKVKNTRNNISTSLTDLLPLAVLILVFMVLSFAQFVMSFLKNGVTFQKKVSKNGDIYISIHSIVLTNKIQN